MHGIDPQIAGPPHGVRLPALANRHRSGPPFFVVSEPLAVARVTTQVVQVPVGNQRQPPKLGLAVVAKLALENAPRGGATQGFVGFIDLCQQLDVGSGIAGGKAMATASLDPHLARGHVAAYQSRELRPAQPRHLSDVAAQKTSGRPSLPRVLLLAQQSLDPAVDLRPCAGLESYCLRGQKELLDLFQT